MVSSLPLQQEREGLTVCLTGHRENRTCCCQGRLFAAAAAVDNGTIYYVAALTQELNFNLREKFTRCS